VVALELEDDLGVVVEEELSSGSSSEEDELSTLALMTSKGSRFPSSSSLREQSI
jgi:hypothetical protein